MTKRGCCPRSRAAPLPLPKPLSPPHHTTLTARSQCRLANRFTSPSWNLRGGRRVCASERVSPSDKSCHCVVVTQVVLFITHSVQSAFLVYEYIATLPTAAVKDILHNGVTIGELTERTLCFVL